MLNEAFWPAGLIQGEPVRAHGLARPHKKRERAAGRAPAGGENLGGESPRAAAGHSPPKHCTQPPQTAAIAATARPDGALLGHAHGGWLQHGLVPTPPLPHAAGCEPRASCPEGVCVCGPQGLGFSGWTVSGTARARSTVRRRPRRAV
jgi:hypothetical protein